jgi:hypothetical protein
MPWRFGDPPHNGWGELYTTPIKTFVCPSSELGNKSPMVGGFSGIGGWFVEQGALHYRGVMGAFNVQPVTGTWSAHSVYTKSGMFIPEVSSTMGMIPDGTSNTLMFGETSSAVGLPAGYGNPCGQWGAIHPWTWGYYSYRTPCVASGGANGGWLCIDFKMLQYPINYRGVYLTNNFPFRSNHPGGAMFAAADGSVHFMSQNMDLLAYYAMGTKANKEVGVGISFE